MRLAPPHVVMPRFDRLGYRVHQCCGSTDPDASPVVRINGTRHPGSRYDRRCRRRFWIGKNSHDVVGAFRRVAHGLPAKDIPWEAGPTLRRPPVTPDPSRRRAAVSTTPCPSRHCASAPAAATPPASPEVPLPPEQAALHQDGDPDDTPGLQAALAQSTEEAAWAAAEEALDETQAVALEAATEEDD
ncbi:hypothetical protein ZWY2020_002584 [Hordeum vulgare]|nr:hypothetical protein ZWY2020_002584 [Hordeum vulgare]